MPRKDLFELAFAEERAREMKKNYKQITDPYEKLQTKKLLNEYMKDHKEFVRLCNERIKEQKKLPKSSTK